MKLVLSVSLLIVANVCLAQTNPPPDKAQASELPDKITIDGVTYENVRWQKPTPSSVEIFHKSGIASIPLWKLPPELQERFGYDPQKATAYSTAEAAARSKQAELNRQAAAKQKERAQVEQQEAAQREWADTVARKEQPRFRNVNGTVYDFAAAIELARKKEPGGGFVPGYSPLRSIGGNQPKWIQDMNQGAASAQQEYQALKAKWGRYLVAGKAIQVLQDGVLVDCYSKVVFVKNFPSQASLADGEPVRFAAMPAGTYSYVNTVGARTTVRAYDFGTMPSSITGAVPVEPGSE